jgi:hypothetical protein
MKRSFRLFLYFIVWVMVLSLIATPVWGKPMTKDHQGPEAVSQEFIIESVGAPVNDNFATATVLTGESGTASGHNYEATMEVDETTPWSQFYDLNSSVWWSWQAPSTGTYAFDSTGDFYNYIFVYSGTDLNSLTALAGNEYVDYDNDTIDRIVFKATAGVTYHIAVYGEGSNQGSIDLAWSKVTPPDNDDLANAILINTASGTESSSNMNATVEPDEAYYLYDPGDGLAVNSVWWKWTAPTTGFCTFDTIGSGMKDTMLDIFTGTSYETLNWLYHNDDRGIDGWSAIRIATTAGTSYYVCVTGYWGFKGDITLNWYENQAPSITSLNETTFTVGSAGTFTVTATGLPDPVVTLTSGSLPSGVIYSSSTKTLSGTPATGTGGVYNLVFTAANGIGSPATQNFLLATIVAAPEITMQPCNLMATVGEMTTFSVTATGSPDLAYQWQVCTSARKNIWTDLAGATESTYSTPAATLKMDGYQYRVIVANTAGSITSDPATLTVYAAPTSQTNVEIDVAGLYDGTTNTIEWTIEVNNAGPDSAENVQVTATLAKFSRLVSVDLSNITGATYKVQGSKVIVSLGTLQRFCEFTLTTDVSRATSPTALTVVATTTSFDPDLSNNTATDEVIWP